MRNLIEKTGSEFLYLLENTGRMGMFFAAAVITGGTVRVDDIFAARSRSLEWR